MNMDFEKIVYFENIKEAHGIPFTRKLIKSRELELVKFLGIFETKDILKNKYPNSSIILSSSNQLSNYYKLLLNNIYRKSKIFNILNTLS